MIKTLVLCDGTPPSKQLFVKYRQWADFFIAADGGILTAKKYQSIPDILIGDLDSYKPADDEPFEVIFDPDQETNDLEKALNLAAQRKSSHVYILGGTGKRIDHTLKNLSVLKQFDSKFDELILRDDFGDTFILPREFSTSLPVGTSLSLFPLSGIVSGIATEGLKYSLDNEKLENGVRDGSSNEVVESEVKISYQQGDLLIFIAKH